MSNRVPVYLVVDVETTGLFDFSKPADADGQPRMASLAMIRIAGDMTLVDGRHRLIRPDGWVMSEEAGRVNGLTTEYLLDHGIPVRSVLEEYVAEVDAGLIVVAFNAQYDTKVVRGELRRAGMDDRFEKTKNICTMRACTDICRLPGRRGYKFPKLAEACAHFEIPQQNAHSALGDARACVGIMRALESIGALPAADVHYAKNPPLATG